MQNNNISGLIIGQNTIYLDEVASTNTYLSNLLSNFKPLPEGTAILAGHQFAGKGQRKNTWYSEPHKNLTTSIYLQPKFVAIKDQFIVSCTVAVAIATWLQTKISKTIKIKWPNDIYIDSQKIGGILIENKIKGKNIDACIIGIGLNINQKKFPALPHATSLALLTNNDTFDIKLLAHELYHAIQEYYFQLQNDGYTAILKIYNSLLFWKGEKERLFTQIV